MPDRLYQKSHVSLYSAAKLHSSEGCQFCAEIERDIRDIETDIQIEMDERAFRLLLDGTASRRSLEMLNSALLRITVNEYTKRGC
jgi:hypothetical protein